MGLIELEFMDFKEKVLQQVHTDENDLSGMLQKPWHRHTVHTSR
jgi:hypothetical protein